MNKAVTAGNVDLVRQLIAHGVDVNLRSTRGHTSLYFARKHQHADITALLERAGGREE